MAGMPSPRYDVIVLGGAFSGAAFTVLLRRWLPDARVLVVERREEFDQKVGEATVEVSALFLYRVLGLYDELSRTHLPKHGLRYWFTDGPERTLAEMSEIGPSEAPRLPTFQLDRAKLDEHILGLARNEGAEIARPARVTRVDLGERERTVAWEDASGAHEATARWIVDATGRNALLARQMGLHQRTEELPTSAVWARWSGIRDMDGIAVRGADPRSTTLRPLVSARRLATNHFCGYGWWCWVIPLGGGETSIGVVFDKTLFQWPSEGTPLERYRAFLERQPGLRELVAGATMNEADFRGYGHLPHRTSRYAGRGWALVGDAASFLDPYYSPGLDHASISVYATARMIEDDLRGRLDPAALEARIERHNREFVQSYERWLEGLYVGKYELFGDAELTVAAFLLDTSLYYLGVVAPVHRDVENLRNPVLGQDLPQTRVAAWFLRFYARRLVAIARKRRELGIYGRRNVGWRWYLGNVGLDTSMAFKFVKGLRLWWAAELSVLTARAPRPVPVSVPGRQP